MYRENLNFFEQKVLKNKCAYLEQWTKSKDTKLCLGLA